MINDDLWSEGEYCFFNIDRNIGDTMFIKKNIVNCNYMFYYNYYYLVQTYQGIVRYVYTNLIHKEPVKFTYFLHIDTISE